MFLATNTAAPMQLSMLDICLRLLCAMVVGLVIGTEREYTHRPAGMRTHILVALGACSVMIIGQMIFAEYYAYGAVPDPARLAAQVITGMGFLGAGTIIREGANVKGLTTAASLWAVACLGIAAGAGYYVVALTGMVFIFITLTILEVLQGKLIHGRISRNYVIRTADVGHGLKLIQQLSGETHCDIHDIQAERTEPDGYRITFRAEFHARRSSRHRAQFFEALAGDPAIQAVQASEEGAAVK